MNDLISRKALLAEYDRVHIGEPGKARKLIEDAPAVQEWISVKDRLPGESGQYIVCCNDSGCNYGEGIWYQSGIVVCAEVDVGIQGGICWEWREGSVLYDLGGIITHWMPLPQPPKGEEQ